MPVLSLLLFLSSAKSQSHSPFVPDANTIALWHFDETSGNIVIDSSPYSNNGVAYGTTIVPGILGNARYFNGTSDYVIVQSNQAFNMDSSQSFTIDLWFKTTSTPDGWLVRRGLAPTPGFSLGISGGRVLGQIGNRENGSPPDTVLMLFSERTYVDGLWHRVTFVRDRSVHKLFLYVDGVLAAGPKTDNFPVSLTNDRPLTMGRWETLPEYFRGYLDEVTIFKGACHPFASIEVAPAQVNFGNVMVGSQQSETVRISNSGFRDTLRLSSVLSNNNVFRLYLESLVVPPGSSRTLPVTYAPTVVRQDTGTISISSNDLLRPVMLVRLNGRGIGMSTVPVILSIKDIPEDQGKHVRVSWSRSVHDSLGDSLRIANYSLWRRVGASNTLWDFIATIPAVRFTQYAYVAPTLFDSTRATGVRWSVFKVSAHTANNTQVFFGSADSGYSVDNIAPFPPTNLSGGFLSGRVNLSWSEPVDPDFYQFLIYRSTVSNFTPSTSNRIGTSNVNSYSDANIGGSPVYYYRVSALDTSGNEGTYSSELRVVLLAVDQGEMLPTQFDLHQNYPNPFNPSTKISFDVPQESRVMIKIFDLLGREARTLVDEVMHPGRHARVVDAANLSSGIYICRMSSGGFLATRRMVLMK